MMDVAHQPVETFVAERVPFCHAAGESSDRTQQVEASHARCVQDLHEDLRGNGLKGTPRVAGSNTRGILRKCFHSIFVPSAVVRLVPVPRRAPDERGGDFPEVRSPSKLTVASDTRLEERLHIVLKHVNITAAVRRRTTRDFVQAAQIQTVPRRLISIDA